MYTDFFLYNNKSYTLFQASSDWLYESKLIMLVAPLIVFFTLPLLFAKRALNLRYCRFYEINFLSCDFGLFCPLLTPPSPWIHTYKSHT